MLFNYAAYLLARWRDPCAFPLFIRWLSLPGEGAHDIGGDTVGLIDAVRLATEIFRRPITNTLMLGAFAKTTGMVSLDALKRSLEDSDFRDAGLAQNLIALERGYNETTVHTIERRVAA